MRDRAVEDVGDDLHVAMRVRREALTRRHAVVVDHAQRAKAHVVRVAVFAEGKRVPAVEPVEARAAACGGARRRVESRSSLAPYLSRFLTYVPFSNSSNAVSISACVFMTTGPYQAIGSRRGFPAARRKRTGRLSALTVTCSPSPKRTS